MKLLILLIFTALTACSSATKHSLGSEGQANKSSRALATDADSSTGLESSVSDLSGYGAEEGDFYDLIQKTVNGPEDMLLEKSAFARSTVRLNSSSCSATIIANDIAITAGHCVPVGFDRDSFSTCGFCGNIIFHFKTDAKGNAQTVERKIGLIAIHPQHVRRFETNWFGYRKEIVKYDVALIRFEGGLPPGFSPVNVSFKSEESLGSCRHFISGFSPYTRAAGSPIGTVDAKTRRTAEVQSGSLSRAFNSDSTPQAIALSGQPNICSGDSGGSLYSLCGKNLSLIGVASKGTADNCDSGSSMGVFEDLTLHQSWILQTIKKLRAQRSI